MTINWMNFLIVFVVSVGGALVLTMAFTMGTRYLLARQTSTGSTRVVQTVGVVLFWGVAILVGIFGLWLIMSTTSIFAHH
ncbi:hypothetical protein [Propionibacterium sp.]|uniref:hypothetical protein n=1 Tax=Propionibacterium sp. TaxID=1977903 RepID=UPI0039E9577C